MSKVIYQLVSVNQNDNSGVFRYRKDVNGSKWRTIDVEVSALIMWRIKNVMNDGLMADATLVGTKFSSTLNSQMFSENPFKLVHFIPEGNSDIPENYKVEFVFEKRSVLEEIGDVFGDKSQRWLSRKIKPKYWLRYDRRVTVKMLKDINIATRIIAPSMR